MCTCNQISCTSDKPQQRARAAAGRSLVRLYLRDDCRAGFGQCCMWCCSNHNTLQHSVLLGPVVPKMAGCTGSLCLAFPAVFHLESCSHTFSQATPVSFFFVKNYQCIHASSYHLWNAENQGIIAYPEVEQANRQSQWLHHLSAHRLKEILNHNPLESCLNFGTLFCIYFKKSPKVLEPWCDGSTSGECLLEKESRGGRENCEDDADVRTCNEKQNIMENEDQKQQVSVPMPMLWRDPAPQEKWTVLILASCII